MYEYAYASMHGARRYRRYVMKQVFELRYFVPAYCYLIKKASPQGKAFSNDINDMVTVLKTVSIHHFSPGFDKVTHKQFFAIVCCIYFSYGS